MVENEQQADEVKPVKKEDGPVRTKHPFKIKAQLFVSSSNLANLDDLDNSDPFCVVSKKMKPEDEWQVIGQTETIDNNLDPNWVKHFQIDYFFHKPIYLKFDVFDEDSSGEHALIGYIETTLAQILTAEDWVFNGVLLYQAKYRGNIQVKADFVNQCDDDATIQLKADLVTRKWLCFGVDNPYILVERARCLINKENTAFNEKNFKTTMGQAVASMDLVTDWVRIYKTDYIFASDKPYWDPFNLKMSTLCNNNKKLPLRISVLSFANSGEHFLYGQVITSVREIEMGKTVMQLQSRRGQFAGTVTVMQMKLDLRPSLIAYLNNKWKISVGVAIDFTLSNLEFDNPKSNHFQSGRETDMNPYEQSIFEVGSVLETYTYDKKFHLQGFGGQPSYCDDPAENSKTSFCWNLNGKPYLNLLDAKVSGTGGMLSYYQKAVKLTTMTGPTYFAETLKRFLYIVKREQEMVDFCSLYYIFVIITDGCIHDMKETVKIVVDMSYLPVSIIIIGIGDEDFKSMEILDADEKSLQDFEGRTAARDIVQFVPIANLKEMSKIEVTDNLLMEVPHHFVDYMVLKQIDPNQKKPEAEEEVKKQEGDEKEKLLVGKANELLETE